MVDYKNLKIEGKIIIITKINYLFLTKIVNIAGLEKNWNFLKIIYPKFFLVFTNSSWRLTVSIDLLNGGSQQLDFQHTQSTQVFGFRQKIPKESSVCLILFHIKYNCKLKREGQEKTRISSRIALVHVAFLARYDKRMFSFGDSGPHCDN